MNAAEETVAFKHEPGCAIAQWGYVEGQLLRVALKCVAIPDRTALLSALTRLKTFALS